MDGESTPHGAVCSMKSLSGNRFFLLGLRLFVGLAFIVAGVDKMADPEGFAVSVANYRILPDPLVIILATILPWLEWLCGLSLLFGTLVRGASLLVTSMLGVFIVAVLSAILRGLDISCGCFSRDPQVSLVGWGKILENLGFLCAAIVLLVRGEGTFSLEHYLRKRFDAESVPSPGPRP